MTASSGVALATHDLRKSYGSRVALAGLDLVVSDGVVYGFLGPNGAGKTTTMRILTKLIHADEGAAWTCLAAPKRGDRRRLFDVGALVEAPYHSAARTCRTAACAPSRPPALGRVPDGSRSLSSSSVCASEHATRCRATRWAWSERLGIAGAPCSVSRASCCSMSRRTGSTQQA